MDSLKFHIEDSGNNRVIRTDLSALSSNPSAQVVRVRESELIFNAGEMPRGLYFLKSGAVKLVSERPCKRGRGSNPEFINKIVSAGEFFGFKALIFGKEYPFYAQALSASELHIFPTAVITQVMSGSNDLLKLVLQQVAQDLDIHEKTAQLHYLASVQERISYQLALLAEKFGVAVEGGLSLNLRLTRNELAQLAGTINESLSRHLTELKALGIIDVRGKEIIVKNLPELKARSGNFRTLEQ